LIPPRKGEGDDEHWPSRPEAHIAEIVPFMADAGLHHLPVVDEDGHLVGMVTQSDVVAAMFSVASLQSSV